MARGGPGGEFNFHLVRHPAGNLRVHAVDSDTALGQFIIAEVIPVNPQRVSRGNRARCETGDVRNVGKIGIHFKMVNYIAVLIQSDINTQRLNPVGVSQRRVHDFIQRNILVDINPFRGIVLSCR